MRLATIDELHVLAQRLIQETENETDQKKKNHICDAVMEILIMAYVYGSNRTASEVPKEVIAVLRANASDIAEQIRNGETLVDSETLYKAVYKPIDGETFEDRIVRRINEKTLDNDTLSRILETEYHRVEETGAYETADVIATRSGLTAYKQWLTMADERVRDTHWFIHDVSVPAGDRFFTFDGDSARFPGDFSLPDNNVNCRCELKYTFR